MSDFIDLFAIMCGVFLVAFIIFNELFKLKRKDND